METGEPRNMATGIPKAELGNGNDHDHEMRNSKQHRKMQSPQKTRNNKTLTMKMRKAGSTGLTQEHGQISKMERNFCHTDVIDFFVC